MNSLTKTLVGTVAAGAMAVSTASPALARDGDRDHGIGTGEVIAGALIIGGIAAVAAAASNHNNDGHRYGYRDGYDRAGYSYRYGNSRDGVSMCVRAAESDASRYGRAQVTRVTGVSHKRNGYNVTGRIAVDTYHRDWRRSGYDNGRFTCKVRYGRIADINYSGIHGLR